MLFERDTPRPTREQDTPTRFGLQSYEFSTEPPKLLSSKKTLEKKLNLINTY